MSKNQDNFYEVLSETTYRYELLDDVETALNSVRNAIKTKPPLVINVIVFKRLEDYSRSEELIDNIVAQVNGAKSPCNNYFAAMSYCPNDDELDEVTEAYSDFLDQVYAKKSATLITTLPAIGFMPVDEAIKETMAIPNIILVNEPLCENYSLPKIIDITTWRDYYGAVPLYEYTSMNALLSTTTNVYGIKKGTCSNVNKMIARIMEVSKDYVEEIRKMK